MYGVLGADMDSAFETQAQLEDNRKEVRDDHGVDVLQFMVPV